MGVSNRALHLIFPERDDHIMDFILASASPRRAELLRLCGLFFTLCAANADESIPAAMLPEEAVLMLAKRKAKAVLPLHPAACILGADTVVALDGRILNKPRDEAEATAMLRALSGRKHTVFTGVCILTSALERSFVQAAQVQFFPLTEAEIFAYVRTGEPMDKAGAYGIQGRGCTLVQSITGDFYTVMGLPIGRVVRELQTVL